MLSGFTPLFIRGKYPTRANLIDLGTVLAISFVIAVLVGGALVAVVNALIKDLLTPLVAAIVGRPDLSGAKFAINGSVFQIDDLIHAVISFVVITTAVCLVVLFPVRAILARARRVAAHLESTTKQCPECLSTIAIHARRCAFCTSAVSST